MLLRSTGFEDRSRAATMVWLRRVAEHQFRNHQRRKRRRLDPQWIEAVNAVWTAETEPANTRLEALRACLQQLDTRSRELIDAVYRDGARRAALADRFGMKESGIKTRLQRVRAALRRCVEHRLTRMEQP